MDIFAVGNHYPRILVSLGNKPTRYKVQACGRILLNRYNLISRN